MIDCVSNKKYRHSCDLIFIILESFPFWEKSELLRIGVIWLNLSIENPLHISRPWKFTFGNLHSLFHFFLPTRSWQKTKPYTGAMRGTVHEPQVNIGADQKFSSSALEEYFLPHFVIYYYLYVKDEAIYYFQHLFYGVSVLQAVIPLVQYCTRCYWIFL